MPPKILVDLSQIDLETLAYDAEQVCDYIPHRYEMQQLQGVFKIDLENKFAVGLREVGDDEFWVRGHIPGRPLFPGVLMLETAAQLCTFFYKMAMPGDERFLGFGAAGNLKFRGPVVPGDRMIFTCVNTAFRHKLAMFKTQAFVNNRLVFEAGITGIEL